MLLLRQASVTSAADVDMPRRAHGLLPTACRAQEVVAHRMYREADLRRLFRSYIRLAPLSDKDTVTAVVKELARELDVSMPTLP